MKLYIELFKLMFRKFVLRKNNGIIIKKFSENMGVVYIKLAQMLATQNFGNLFSEKDRKMLSDICDNCNKINFDEILEILKQEYGTDLDDIFKFIDKEPVGSASVSQVHRAILKTGEEVAVKIKRKDVTKTINVDIKRIKNIIHRFGKFVKFSNFTGSDKALNLYLGWIEQETNFNCEKENIKIYQNFANCVNGKVEGTKQIKVPKLYENYCTDNVIVMEFINTKTINKIELTEKNKNKITTALNSYIKSSFWAMFNDKQIVFHGDPHIGNICIDEKGNICFLDMGYLSILSDSDAILCRKLFLTAYSGNYEKLYEILVNYGNMSEEKKKSFKEDCKKYCEEVNKKEVSNYFVDMINICLNYEFVPPNFIFSMAKAFVYLNGISSLSCNTCTAKELLQEQIMEYLVKRSLKDCKGIVLDSLHFAPKALENISQYGLVKTIAKVTTNNDKRVIKLLENLKEMVDLIKLSYKDERIDKSEQSQQKNEHVFKKSL